MSSLAPTLAVTVHLCRPAGRARAPSGQSNALPLAWLVIKQRQANTIPQAEPPRRRRYLQTVAPTRSHLRPAQGARAAQLAERPHRAGSKAIDSNEQPTGCLVE